MNDVQQGRELIFAYNADSPLLSVLIDFYQKLIVPKKYKYNLCMVTYGPFAMRRVWKEYIQSLDIKSSFLHRNEFRDEFKKYSSKNLPVMFVKHGENLEEVITASEMNKIKNVSEMIKLVS